MDTTDLLLTWIAVNAIAGLSLLVVWGAQQIRYWRVRRELFAPVRSKDHEQLEWRRDW